MKIWCTVAGEPKPQARPRKGKHGNFYSPKNPWFTLMLLKFRELRAQWQQRGVVFPITAAMCPSLWMTFYFTRPKEHYRSNGELKEKYIKVPHSAKPDLDNLSKAVLDALVQAGVLEDDAHVTRLLLEKRYVNPHSTDMVNLNKHGGLDLTLVYEAPEDG